MGKPGAKPSPAAPPAKVIKPSSKASVVVFDQSKYGISRLKSLDGKAFKRKPAKAEESDEEMEVPAARPKSNDPDDIADMEVSQLWERLKTTVEDVASSTLTGRDRRNHLVAKAARLSGKEIVKPQAPFKIRMGMQMAEKKREKKAKESAREMDGVVLASKYTTASSSGKKGTRGVRHRR